MRRLIIFINIFICILFGSCNPQPIPSDASPSIGEIISRDAIASTSITNGTPALFNATGGATIDNQIFTYNNGVWQNAEGEDIPINTTSETTLTAICPAYSGETLITHNPYDNDTLQDVLIAQSTFINQTDVQLKFRHLFSRLTVHVHSSIANEIESVTIEVPKVASIDPSNGTFTTSGTHSTRPIETNTGIYSCIVPSLPDCPVKLTFTFGPEKEVVSSIPKHTFVSGHKYECHVNRPGIRNAEDLIAFSQFINDPNNKGKMHPDFGEKFGDSIVYRLLADIKLELEDCEKLAPIGDHQDTPFYDTFDGEGHTISDFILPDENTLLQYSGLFGHIETTGVINNLHVKHATSIKSPTCKYVGVIAAYNGGVINNCSVLNSRINSFEEAFIGLICGTATGKILNCFTENDTIDVSKSTNAGAIAGSSSGYIKNCYTYKNTFYMSSKSYAGCILGTCNKAKIENCYIYHSKTNDRWGAAIGNSFNANIKNFYYNRGTLAYNTSYSESNTGKYNNKYSIGGTHISNLLNQWVGEQKIYRRWTTDDDGSPCFE